LAVYLLLDTIKPMVYVGQTDDAWKRVNEHDRGKDWWRTAIVLASKSSDGLALDDIKWLEWQAIRRAKELEHHRTDNPTCFLVDNAQEPDQPCVPDARQRGLCDLFDRLRTLVSVLGYPVFELSEDIDAAPAEETTSTVTPSLTFRCQRHDADATGRLVEAGFEVRKGSVARPAVVASARKYVRAERKRLRDEGALIEDDAGRLRFTQDCTFPSPSYAACVLLGQSVDGRIAWETEDGKPLGEVIQAGDDDGSEEGKS
jgi:hypothetical protein